MPKLLARPLISTEEIMTEMPKTHSVQKSHACFVAWNNKKSCRKNQIGLGNVLPATPPGSDQTTIRPQQNVDFLETLCQVEDEGTYDDELVRVAEHSNEHVDEDNDDDGAVCAKHQFSDELCEDVVFP